MDNKIKVALLGFDEDSLKKMCEKMNSSRPVEISYHTDLKMFLASCMNETPDFVGLSLSFPHSSIGQFPKVIKMSMNVPVLTFGEDLDAKTRKLLSSTTSDYKISGKVNAHNLWMKIVSYQKSLERVEEEEKRRSSGEQEKEKGAIFLKGSQKENEEDVDKRKSKNKLLNSLFAELDKGESEESKKLNIVRSTSATEYKGKNTNHINTIDMRGLDEKEEDPKLKNYHDKNSTSKKHSFLEQQNNLNDKKDSATEETNNKTGQITKSMPKGELPKNQTSEKKDSIGKEDQSSSEGPTNNKKSGEAKKQDSQGEGNKKDNSDEDSSSKKKGDVLPFDKNKKKKHNSNESSDKNKEEQDSPEASANNKKSGEAKKQDSQGEGNKKDNSENNSLGKKNKNNDNESDQSDSKSKENRKSNQSSSDEKNKKENEKEFGKVKLSDEKEIKTKEREKKKKQEEQKKEKIQNALVESCDLSLKELFLTTPVNERREFDGSETNIFIVDGGPFKGFLMLANSFNQVVDANLLEQFRSRVIELMKERNLIIEVSQPHLISTVVADYVETFDQFTEFLINHEEETGQQHVVSFVSRELVRPKMDESDKDGMYFVDIKSIPPQTTVNFDAFLYLPKNKRFVRYLKEGRCISLEQAKRHTEIFKNNKFYVPKEHKQKFIQFYIQNTIDWELAIHKKKAVS